MRSGPSGMYASSRRALGFDLCMMKETQLNGTYWDAYLRAVIVQSGVHEGRDVADFSQTGYAQFAPEDRWIVPMATGEPLMSCRDYGFELRASSDANQEAMIVEILDGAGSKTDNGGLEFRIPQHQDAEGKVWDRQDRILTGARLLRKLVTALATVET